MTRLTDLPSDQARRLAELECPDFETQPWVAGPALSQRRVAIVSSAGLVVRGDARDLQSFHARLGLSTPGAETPWGAVTQGRFSTSWHSSSAKRLARSGGKSVSLVTEPVLASAKGDGIASSCRSLSLILDRLI